MFNFQECKIGFFVQAHYGGGQVGAIIENHFNFIGARYHMMIGYNIAVAVDNKA